MPLKIDSLIVNNIPIGNEKRELIELQPPTIYSLVNKSYRILPPLSDGSFYRGIINISLNSTDREIYLTQRREYATFSINYVIPGLPPVELATITQYPNTLTSTVVDLSSVTQVSGGYLELYTSETIDSGNSQFIIELDFKNYDFANYAGGGPITIVIV